MDWGTLEIRPGAYYCPEHGRVRPRREIVPACPQCGRAAHLAVRVADGVTTQELMPLECAGEDRHSLGPGYVAVGTWACTCAPDGTHRTWTCRRCGDVQVWPPHDELAAEPYYGPGSGLAG